MNTNNLVGRLNQLIGEEQSLGSTLRAIRLCDGLTQKQFTELLGITVSYLSDIENRRKLVSPKKAYM